MKAIVATDKNGLIGRGDEIPWHCPEDLKWFKEFTWNKRLIVGNKTWNYLPELKHRNLAVITSDPYSLECSWGDSSSYDFVNNSGFISCSPEFVIKLLDNEKNFEYDDFTVIGGARTYKTFLPYITEFYQTLVDVESDGDVYLEFEFNQHFSKVESFRKLSEKATVYKWSK